MADTTFAPGTVIKADWLQDVNDVVYGGGLTGDAVSGPPSSTDGGVAFFDDTTGKVINSSSLLIGNVVSLDQGQTLHNKSMDSGCGWVGNTINPIFGGTGQSTYTTGDMLYSNGTNGLTKLPIGTAGEVLTVVSGAPSWESPSGAGLGDVSGPASAVSNNITTFDGTSGKLIKDSGIAIPASTIVGTTDTQTLSNKTMGSGCIWNGTDVAIADGGTGASTAQAAINNLTAVSAATAGHVLTKVGSDAVWAASVSGSGYDSWGDTTWVNTFHNTDRTVTSDVVADAQIISVAEVGKHGIVAASKSSGNAATGAQSTIGVASFVNNDNTANPQSAYGAYIETVRKSGASTTHGIEVGLTNYGTTVDSSPYNASPTGLTEVARLAVNTGIEAGTKVSHALSIVSVNESTSYANKFSKGIVFHNMALDGTNGNDGNKATALALARGHSLDWFVYTGSGSGDLGPRLTSNVSVAADAMQQVFENKEVSFNNNVGTQSVAIKNNGILNLKNNTGTVSWTENGDVFVTDNKLYAVLNSVAKEVSFTSSGNRLLSVLDYGAVGNGVADDTTAIQNCINACFSTGKNMLVPAGTYLVTSLTMNSDTYANHFSIFGEGRNKTIIRKYSTSSAALLTIGDTTPAIFQANITVEGITFDGLNTTSAVAVRTYDMVRSSFKDCTFMRANVGFAFNGGVANQFYNCMFDACNYGVFMQWVSGMVSQPNETLFNGCQFVNNYLWGLYFTHGALVVLDACEIEGNGTSGNSSTGGVYAGSLETLAPSLINSQGIIAQGCWFEANAGRASCYFTDGRNTVRDSYFIANPNSTYEVYVSGGTYVIENCSFQNSKTYHIYETAGASSGNYINANTGSVTVNTYVDAAKTKLDYNSGYPVQRGYGATSGGVGTLTVTFTTPFATIPNVQCQVVNNDTSQLIMTEVYNVTTTGFTVRAKAITSGSATVYGLAAGIYWTAAQWY